MDIAALRAEEARYIIGLDSDPNCLGTDAALARLRGTGAGLQLKPLVVKHYPYEAWFRARLATGRATAKDIGCLHYEVGERLAEAAADLQTNHGADGAPQLIGAMGHAAAHAPRRAGQAFGNLTLGESAVIAERTGLPVVSNFAARDIAAHGQGGPLTGYADWVMFHRHDRTSLRIHLGGLARVTVVTPAVEDMLAFETGPCMMALDGALQILTSGTHLVDPGGQAAAKGVVISDFFEDLMEHSFFHKVPPKTTGITEFGPEIYLRDAIKSRLDRGHSMNDFAATVTAVVATSIIRAFNRFIKPRYNIARVIFSGSGAGHKPLMKALEDGLTGMTLRNSSAYGLGPNAIGPLAAAILANEFVFGAPTAYPKATGAKHPTVLGQWTPA